MAGIVSVGQAFSEFTTWLPRERKDYGGVLDGLKNGFEGWLKIEFYAWLVRHKNAVPGQDIGLEHKVKLDQRRTDLNVTKQCDLWIRDSNGDKFHYIELKAPFAECNSGKMLQGAGYDLWYIDLPPIWWTV